MKDDLQILRDFDNETAIQLIDSAYTYLLDKDSLPLKKLTFNVRAPFSAIYAFLRGAPGKQIAKLDSLTLSKEIKQALKEKVYLLYASNFQKVGLLTNYKTECLNPKAIEYQGRPADTNAPLDFVSCQWKINVVLSTNYLSKVLRPEVVIEIQTAQQRKVKMTVSAEKFEELRRQVAYLLRYT